MNSKTNTSRSYRFSWAAYALLGNLLIVYLTSCGTTPEGSSELKQQALSFTPPTGKANVYVVRPDRFSGKPLEYGVNLDLQPFGTLANNSYLYGVVLPGKHGLQGTIQKVRLLTGGQTYVSAPLNFVAEADKNYYFRLDLGGIGPWSAPKLVQVSETEAKSYLEKAKLSPVNRFEYHPGNEQ
jgi:hypothetical protein